MKIGGRYDSAEMGRAVSNSRKSAANAVLRILVIFLLVILIALLIFFSKIFAVDELNIIGTERFGDSEIRAFLDGYIGENGFLLILRNNSVSDADKALSGRLTELEQRLLFEAPYLKDVVIKYSPAGSIEISVKERNAVLFIKVHDDYICVDDEGFVLEIMTEPEFEAFRETDSGGGTTVVRGLDIDEYMPGKALPNDIRNTVYNTVNLCAAINENPSLCGKIDYVDVSIADEIYLTALPSLVVEFGSFDGMYDRVLRLAAIFESGYDGESAGTIDFTTGGYDVFRPNTNPVAENTQSEGEQMVESEL